ncbi:MAG TPA: VOC family protein [Solirubrobacteraceae bacterium]|nr:VOC family protein [Solirubrobacteraceae bacterium]
MSITANRIGEIGLVAIPTTNQDALVDFYVGKLGFEKRTDTPFGNGYRWIEVYPPSGSTGIALAPPPPSQGEGLGNRQTGIILNTHNIDAAHAELRDSGVDVDAEVSRMGDPVPPMFWFRDPDGNSLLIVQPS